MLMSKTQSLASPAALASRRGGTSPWRMTSSGQEDTCQHLPSHHTGLEDTFQDLPSHPTGHSMAETSSTLKVLYLGTYSRSIPGLSPPPLEEQAGLPEGWEAKRSPEGTVFYVNHNQRRTTFERPGRGGGERETGPSSPNMVLDLPVSLPTAQPLSLFCPRKEMHPSSSPGSSPGPHSS